MNWQHYCDFKYVLMLISIIFHVIVNPYQVNTVYCLGNIEKIFPHVCLSISFNSINFNKAHGNIRI